jgi:hypothetical protein
MAKREPSAISPEILSSWEERLEQSTIELKESLLSQEGDPLLRLELLDDLIAKFPLPLQDLVRHVIMPADIVRQMIEVQRWFDEDEHLQRLLADM